MIGVKMDLVLSLVSLTLISILVPSYAYGRIAALQPMPAPIQTQTQMVYTQCIDFDMDKICEYIVLANGTTIANPLVQQLQAPAPMSQLVERQKIIVQQQQRDNDNDRDYRDDPDCWYGNLYVCDENGECDSDKFDCITDCADGSSVTTGFDCPDEDDNSDRPASDNNDCEDTGGSDPCGEEADQNCGGEACTDDEKEDSWVDEPAAEEEGTWEDDGYIDENEDGNYDEGEE
jgi:hypothetical protein